MESYSFYTIGIGNISWKALEKVMGYPNVPLKVFENVERYLMFETESL
jgi:hypothetical protein